MDPHAHTTISFTALQFSFDDLQKEMKSLSKEEANSIALQRKGLNALFSETDEMRERALNQLEEALEGIEDKEDYLRALKQCPELVKTESNPILFLRCEEFDVWAAALRMTKYWKMRCRIFKERAFLPMTMTGEGTLTSEDVLVLRTGVLQCLKDVDRGRAVIYCRRSILNKDAPEMIKRLPRVLLYLMSVAVDDSVAQRHGLVIIVDTEGVSVETFDRKQNRLEVGFLAACVPIKIRCVHMFFPAHRCIGKLLFPFTLWMMGPELRKLVSLHTPGRPRDYLFDLEACGMRAEHLPVSMGGSFRICDFCKQLDERLALETARQNANGDHGN